MKGTALKFISKHYAIRIAEFACKFILANIIAVAATSVPIYFYDHKSYTLPTLNGCPFPHQKSYSHYCQAVEGYCNGTLDFNGFNNLYCVENNVRVLSSEQGGERSSVHSLLLGSSEMFAANVAMNKNCCYLINKKLEKNDRFLLYNVGIPARALVEVVYRYEDALDYFQPKRYVILETRRLPQYDEVNGFKISEKTPTKGTENKLLAFIAEHIYSICWMRTNMKRGLVMRRQKAASGSVEKKEWNEENVDCLRNFLRQISEQSRLHNVRPILFYHPRPILSLDGSATLEATPELVELYRTECEKQGIVFLYLGERFMREYEENNILPYGFWNTLPNTGHLNKDGHRMIADELCKVIERLEEERKGNVQ